MKAFKRNLKKIIPSHFSTKLFIAFFSCVIIPFSFIMLINNYRSQKLSINQAIYSNEKVLSQAASFLEYKITSLKNIIDIISFDNTVQEVLTTSNSYYRENQGNWFIQTTDMKNIIYNSYTTSDIKSVRLYMQNGPASFEETTEFRQLSDAEQADWYERIDNATRFSTVWVPSSFFDSNVSSPYVSIVKRIPNLNSINKHIGIIKGDVPNIFFQQIIDQMTTTPNTSVIVYNAYHERITSAGDKQLTNIDTVQKIISENKVTSNGSLLKISYMNKDYLIGSYDIEQADWKLVMFIPMSDLLASSNVYRNQIIYMAFLVLAYLVPAMYIISHSITKRIRLLKKHMKKAIVNNFEIAPLDNGHDEIGELTESFDHLVKKIKVLMDEQYAYGYEIKNLELKVLQSLINPHFLYNTLDLIYWQAIDNDVPVISDTVDALGQFYRLSLNRGNDMIKLQDELDHVKAYVKIQNMRFENKIKLMIHVDEKLYTYPVIKIILQPLVENAILHGIRERESASGTIYIKAREKENNLLITVADDGVGMSEDTLHNLLLKSNQHSGYGVWNINERITLCYGKEYGLSFTSQPNKGTCVFITLPILNSQSKHLQLQ